MGSMQMPTKITLLLLVMLLNVAGCAGVRMYDGPEKSAAEIGRLFTTGTRVNLRMHSLNGKAINFVSPRILELAPGPHVLEITASNQVVEGSLILVPGLGAMSLIKSSPRFDQGSYRIEFPVQAGYTYAFTYSSEHSGPLPDELCIFGEPHNAPGSKENYTKEFRTMSSSAKAVGCGIVRDKKEVVPAAEASAPKVAR